MSLKKALDEITSLSRFEQVVRARNLFVVVIQSDKNLTQEHRPLRINEIDYIYHVDDTQQAFNLLIDIK